MAIRTEPRHSGRPARLVAVDVAFHAVRAVEVEVRPGGARVLKHGAVAAPAGMWTEGLPARDLLAQAVRGALSAAGIGAASAAACLPRRLVTLKLARLPHATPEQIRGMVQFEAQQYIPFPIDEVIIGHQVLSTATDDLTTVIIAAARRELVDAFIEAFESAGVEVSLLSVSTVALAQHAQQSALPTCLLSVEGFEAEVAVVADGRLLFSRATDLSEAPGDNPLVDEVVRSLTGYQTENRAQPVSSILIAGPRPAAVMAQGRLAQALDLPTSLLDSALLPAADPELIGFAAAAGLALEAGAAADTRVDLVPTSRTARKVVARRRVHLAAALAVAAVAVAAAAMYLFSSMAAGSREQARAVAANNRLDAVRGDLKREKARHDDVVATYQTVSRGLARAAPAVDVLKTLSDAATAANRAAGSGRGLYLTQFAFDRAGSLVIHGNTHSDQSATELVMALQGSGAFGGVRLTYLGDAQSSAAPGAGANAVVGRSRPGEVMSFVISCQIRVEAPPAAEGRPTTAVLASTSAAGGRR